MRKAIIMLLAVLMLIAFVSCSNEPKISAEEMTKAIEDFYVTAEYTEKYCLKAAYNGTHNLADWDSTTASSSEVTLVNNIINELVANEKMDEDGVAYSDFTVTSAKGTVVQAVVSAEETDGYVKGQIRTILKGVKLSYSYTENSGKKTNTLALDYSVIDEAYLDSEGTIATGKIIESMTVNGATCKPAEYEITVSFESYPWTKVTEAACDGVELDCDLVSKRLLKFFNKY